MLKNLIIKNIAIIKELELSFDNGLTVLSGETGAGKSIIVDSLNFLLGAKTDKTLLKSGEKEASVQGLFYINDNTKEQLKALGIEADEESILLSRILSSEGKTECRVNGQLITLSMLRNITDSMVDIHGQHEHQSLLKPSSHIKLLDAYTKDILKVKSEVADIYHQYKKYVSELSSFGLTDSERERMLDLLNFQIKEITDAKLKAGEEEELLSERAKIINFEKITRVLGQAFEFLDGTNGADFSVSESLNALALITRFDSEYESVFKRLESVQYELDDIITILKDKANDLDFDEKAADKIENRLELIKNLKKKYGSNLSEINNFLECAQKDFDRLNSSEKEIERLKTEIEKLSFRLYEKASLLSQKRRASAKEFCIAVQKELNDLGMAGSKFEITFNDIPVKEKFLEIISAEGFDKLEFFMSANIGEPSKPLAKIVSGGEMSRIMLALKVILSKLDNIDTMIFDEIDTGISGRIGQTIAHKLAEISRSRQVITITHLAAICAMADQNFLIFKNEDNGKTYTKVSNLNYDQTIQEIARLSGSYEMSKYSYEHAKELKSLSDNYKSKL